MTWKRLIATLILSVAMPAQVYSPRVLRKTQPDASDLHRLAQGIYEQADAHTPRERAEAIWRFFLTDGRFVKPGFWYHIAGWAYEEPMGEVLDPLKLLNSYGFGLCYHIAPVLASVWKAGGFADARVWFLTGHTVAEVFYDGGYHYFDSDMMGYNAVGSGPVKQLPVASVHQIEKSGGIIESKLLGPKQVNPAAVDTPWYPADVRAGAIGGLARLFTTTADNWLFPFERAPAGHSMEFVLRPGERLIEYFHPESERLYYLPYKQVNGAWLEFPQPVPRYHIRTEDGPRSQKDSRVWATGRLEYRPAISHAGQSVYEVYSPYVIIDADFQLHVALDSNQQTVSLETSTDGGSSWSSAGVLVGPFNGNRSFEPGVLTRSKSECRTAVSGSYGYLLRITKIVGAVVRDALVVTRFQLNPRTLPELTAGRNDLIYNSGPARVRRSLVVDPRGVREIAERVRNARYVSDGSQGYWIPEGNDPAEFVFRVSSPNGNAIDGLDAGGRFLDLSAGLAPDKFTAEVRQVPRLAAKFPAASIAWSASADGPYHTIWSYDPELHWRDGQPVDRVLRWPEVDRHVDVQGARTVFVRYEVRGMAVDDFRLATVGRGPSPSPTVQVTHLWKEDGVGKSSARDIPAGAGGYSYSIQIPAGANVQNDAVVFECSR